MGRKKQIKDSEVELNIETPKVESTPEAISKNDDMLVGRIHKQQYASTKEDINKIVAAKIQDRIEAKKQEFIDRARSAV